jgi:tetratricopeptide (TPR) repeat protein
MGGRRVALLVATDRYQDSGLSRLAAPASDARRLAAVLSDMNIAGFEVTRLYNKPQHVVGRAIGDFYRDRRRDDLTLLYFTGHGVKDEAGNLYLAMTDTDRGNLQFTGVQAEQIRVAMDECLSRQKVLVLDCCYAGAFPAGLSAKGDSEVHALEQLTGRGCVVLTSSDAMQLSFEGDQVKETGPASLRSGPSSLFTRFLIEGLRTGKADLDGDGDITLDELYSYVHDRVTDEQPLQRPKIKEDVEGRICVAQNVNWTLPSRISDAISSPYASAKLSALEDLRGLYNRDNAIVKQRVLERVRTLSGDDSRSVSDAAHSFLSELAPESKNRQTGDQAERDAQEAARREAATREAEEQAAREAAAQEAARREAEERAAREAARREAEERAPQEAASQQAQEQAAPKAAAGEAEEQGNPQEPSANLHEELTAEQHLAQADFFCGHQRYAEAEAAYRAAIALDPASARSYAGLAAALHGLQRHAEADLAYQSAIRLDPSLTPTRRNLWLAQVYANARKAEDSSDWGTAIAQYRRIVQADSAYQDAQIRLNNCQRQNVASRPPGQQTTTTGAQGPPPDEDGSNSPTYRADKKAVSQAIIVIRREGGKIAYAARAFQLIVDGNKTGTIRAGECSEFAVAPGTHRIKLRVDYLSSPESLVTLSDGERASFVCGIARLGTLIKLERE